MLPGSRFSPYTDSNHQAPLWIATSLTLAYAGLFFMARMVIKYKLLSWDDLVLAIANGFGLVQWALQYAALNVGVGKVIPPDGKEVVQGARLFFASRIVTMITVGLAKCSVVLFLRQIFQNQEDAHLKACNITLAIVGCWAVVSPMIISIGCHPAEVLSPSSFCSGDTTRWWLVTGIDVALEVLLAALPWYLFQSVRVSKARRACMGITFSVRFGVVVLFIAYCRAYMHFRSNGPSSLEAVPTLTLQQALCGYALMSATIPSLKSFLSRFFTDGGGLVSSIELYSDFTSQRKQSATIAQQTLPGRLHDHEDGVGYSAFALVWPPPRKSLTVTSRIAMGAAR